MWKIEIIFELLIILFGLINSGYAQKRSFYVATYGSISSKNEGTPVLAKATISNLDSNILYLLKHFRIKTKFQGQVKTCKDLINFFNINSGWVYPDNNYPVHCCPAEK